MTIERKVGMGIAGQPSGATDVAEVFSTHLYTGNSGTNVINNGIDLAGEGGLVWFKCRNVTNNHYFVDTERGASKLLYGPAVHAETSSANSVTSFNSNGFTLGTDDTDGINKNTRSQVSWTFRKKSGFFDCVTWTGNGVAGRTIAHSLGCDIGMLIIKRTNASHDWTVYHKGLGNDIKFLKLNATSAEAIGDGALTSTTFKVNDDGWGYDTNVSGGTYVAYVFADNSAEDAEDQMIKCGSYTGTGSTHEVALGWEPQFLLVKSASSSASWRMLDTMRGFIAPPSGNEDSKLLFADSSSAEDESGTLNVSSNGFIVSSDVGHTNVSGQTYTYMAIRAPMMKEPGAATDVFAAASRTGASGDTPCWVSGFVTDMTIMAEDGLSNNYVATRLTGDRLVATDADMAEASGGGKYTWDYMTGFNWYPGASATNRELMWKRAKGYFDVVAYSGSGSASTVPHSLGVVPEMIWTKYRNGAVNWAVYHSGIGNTKHLRLNDVHAQIGGINFWNNTTPTDTHFTVGTDGETGHSSGNYIAFLFASLDGISKVGNFVGNGSSQTISCGFSAGSRFILIKRTDTTGDWYVWNSSLGIVAGSEKHNSFNTTAATTQDDSVDPANAGFIVNQVSATNINVSSATYIFYAIA